MKYTEPDIESLYQGALSDAYKRLACVSVARGRSPAVKGLSGWIYEQTIRSCIEDELKDEIDGIEIDEQVSLHGRAKLDLVIGPIAIEIKGGGFFGALDAEKYRSYRKAVESSGKRYLYLTAHETYQPYRELAADIFGEEYAFFLDSKGSWERFIKTIQKIIKGA